MRPPRPLLGCRALLRLGFTAICGLSFISTAVTAQNLSAQPASEATPNVELVSARALLEALNFPRGKRVPYTESQMNPMLKQPVSQSGHVEITADGALVMQVTSPRPELRRLEQGQLSLQRPSKSALRRNPTQALANARARTLTLNPEHGGHLVLLAITQVLSGDIEALSRNFSLQSTPGEPWHVVLTPKSEKVQKRLQRLELIGNKNQLLSLYTQRTTDAWQKITFVASDLEPS